MTSERYPAHLSYEDSGIPSCPMRPAHWGITRLKFISELNPSKSQVRHLDPLTTVTFLPMEAIGENGELDVSQERTLKDVRNGYTFLGEGDVCIAKITPCFENGKGAIISGTANGIAFATTEVIPFRCRSNQDARFLYYLLTSAPFRPDAEASMYGAGGQKRVADSFAGNYSAVFPPSAEQTQIAKFLDYETLRIDALIEKQQQLIALLKEKRQAVISHAVTKGLNPDAPMRDSGVEWLGEVPAHWGTMIIRRLTVDHKQGYYTTAGYVDDGVKLLRITDLRDFGSISIDDCPSVRRGDRALSSFLLRKGDFVFARTGGAGSFGLVHDLREDVAFASYLIRFRFNDELVLPEFLKFYLLSKAFLWAVKLNIHGGVNQNIHAEDIKNAPIALPTREEQWKVAKHLSELCAKVDTVSRKAESQVQLLQERRTALISAAVTGKIDVRGWKAPKAAMEEVVA